ncbi:N-acetylglucosamine-1-phosphotransferase subunit gamma-like isoform X1 [Diadema antillarum]|uniref:N-acetylglucosamine-1-phosphotransferase subunit gamma-like isoform X1 n=1 Tax=Diadema antillarum TaxID=105358 RepID=UPI003A87F297
MAASWHLITAVFLQIIFLFDDGAVFSEEIRMRLVEEPINLGNQQWNAPSQPKVLVPKVQASNFSGPPHLRRLLGRCFSKVEANYKYELCPFQNVTQHEQSLRWNPYSGILGIYEEWGVANNTFQSMIFRNGDECGQKNRQVTVQLKCGTKHEIASVGEPHTCEYLMIFKSPLVCHNHSLLVYPILSVELQEEWNVLESRLYREEITKKGYDKMLHKILESAGLVRDPKVKPIPIKQETDRSVDDFTSLDMCKEEYTKLKSEVERLKSELDSRRNEPVNGMSMNFHHDYDAYDDM